MTKVKRATKKGNDSDLIEITYEGYGPAGVAVLVECMTDNKNRTIAEVRHIFSKYNGNLGASGSVSYLFNKIGHIVLEEGIDEEKVLDLVLDFGGDDISKNNEGKVAILVPAGDYHRLLLALEEKGFNIESSELDMTSSQLVQVPKGKEENLIKLLDALEELDDVQNVFSNASFDESN